MNKWISVKERAPQLPCIGLDVFNQVFVLRAMVSLMAEGEMKYFDGACWDLQTMDFREVELLGEKAKIMTEVKYWMPFPQMPND